MKKKIDLILYHTNPLEFGGIDTFDYNFCKRMKEKINILLLYKDGNQKTLKRLKNIGVKIEKYDENKKYVCDICLCASAWGGYPDTVIAKTGRYIQMVHADYIRAKEVDFVYKKWFKTTEHVGVGEHVCKVFKKLYPNEKITKIYNLLDEKKETKNILKLVSATRISKEKGYERMYELAKILKENGIKFRWTIFTDLQLYNQKPFDMEEFVYMRPSHDFFDYIVEADYGVQLSDTEGYCYFINECLQYGTPVISTNYPSAYEMVEDGKNGYLFNMDLSNVDIEKIVNKIPKNFIHKEVCDENDWLKLFNKKEDSKKVTFMIKAKTNYTDKRPELVEGENLNYDNLGNIYFKKGDVYYIHDENRAKVIEESGLAIVQKI